MRRQAMVPGAAAVAAALVGGVGMSAASPAAGSGPRCRAGDLAGAIIDVQGAAGSRSGRLVLVNTSSRTCHAKGFVGARLIGPDGRPLATHVTRDHSTPARTVVIRSGAAGAVEVRWNVVPSGSEPCPLAHWLRVTPPDATTTLRVYFGSRVCRGDLEVRAVTNPATVR